MKTSAIHQCTMNTYFQFLSGKLLLVAGLMLTFLHNSYSQSPGKSETLTYINNQLCDKCKLSVSKATLIANYTSSDGTSIREDKVFSGALDTAVTYDETEQLLSIPCLNVEGNCVTRSLYIQKIRRQYVRISFAISDKKQALDLKIAFKHLIRILSEPKYKDEIVFN